jgi:hypothetical protein
LIGGLDTVIKNKKKALQIILILPTQEFTSSITTYVGGAFAFAQESLKRFFEDHGEAGLVETGGEKKGVSFSPYPFSLYTTPTKLS